uniref:pyrroline-5-carboxylate reductase family protein n=1 Tax=Brevundimonas sp. TaxID=1871086 RepID=UPI003A8DDFC6
MAKAEAEHSSARPVVLLGCGRLGSAIAEGWLATAALDPAELIILTPSEKPVAEAARKRGAWINPPLEALADARGLVVAVKPAMWRAAVAPLVELLPADIVIVSVMAGVPGAALTEAFAGRAVVRVMPTTAVAQGRGVA